jgi:hypothetical protein
MLVWWIRGFRAQIIHVRATMVFDVTYNVSICYICALFLLQCYAVFLKCWMSKAKMLDVFVFFSGDCDMILTCNMLFKRNWDLLHIMFLFFATWICSNVAEDFCYMSQIL